MRSDLLEQPFAMATESQSQPHALLFPFPAQGHIKPFMELAKLLSSRGFYITFVNTEYVQDRLTESAGSTNCEDISKQFEGWRLETVPDGLPPEHGRTQNVVELCKSMQDNGPFHFRNLLEKLCNHNNTPPVNVIISDGLLSYTQEIAKEFGIPRIYFWTASACGLLAYLFIPLLMEKGYAPLKDESYLTNGYLDEILTCMPAMPPLRFRDLPSFCRATDASDFLLNNVIRQSQNALEAAYVIINTFDELEEPILKALCTTVPLHSIGPLLLFGENQSDADEENTSGSSLWKEETSCLKWLDGQEPCSVVYVCFGSMTVISDSELLEFAWGLASSKEAFLWVIRPDLVRGESAVLPKEFVEETKNRGLLVRWAPQTKVLCHPSVGAFLTHCGWNSTIESICGGVPMICWPVFAEQCTNRAFVCGVWKIGLELQENVQRSNVETMIRTVMKEPEGEGMRTRINALKESADRSVSDKARGSSYHHFNKVVDDIIELTKPELFQKN